MNKRFAWILVLLAILGSTIVSSMDTLSYTFKSFFYGVSMAILLILVLLDGYKYFKKDRNDK